MLLRLIAGLIVGGMIIISACGGGASSLTSDDEAEVRRVVDEAGDALSEEDWSRLYDLLPPSDREDCSRGTFVAGVAESIDVLKALLGEEAWEAMKEIASDAFAISSIEAVPGGAAVHIAEGGDDGGDEGLVLVKEDGAWWLKDDAEDDPCDFSTNQFEGAMDLPDFQTPMAGALDAGVQVYWMGEEVEAGGLLFQITAGSSLIESAGNASGLKLSYAAELSEGTTAFDVISYTTESGGAGVARERALARGAAAEDVVVGPWPGELFTFSSGTRPVNALWLFLDLGETFVAVRNSSGTTGVPGEDSSPLIQADLLFALVEEHLRPYPE